jgi:hypothetical protein
MEVDGNNARALAERLRTRRGEIATAILIRVYSVSNPADADSDYATSLRSAVATALDFGISAIERGAEDALPVPAELLGQARLAALNGVSLETVMRRYFAGFALLGDFLIQETQDGDLFDGATLQRLMAGLSILLDHIVAAVSDEHSRAVHGGGGPTEELRAGQVRRLLAGELLDATELAYDFKAWHLGLLAAGAGAVAATRELADALEWRLLIVPAGEETHWAWLGSSRETDPETLQCLVLRDLPATASLAIGEPAQGMEGWRLTHRQALAASPIALRRPGESVRYADVALLVSILRDDLLAKSLRQLFLAPLSEERDGGRVLRETLRAYFVAERNVSSAAAALGVNRNTVTNRLRTGEQRLGRSLGSSGTEVEAALRLDAVDSILPHSAFSRG